MLQTFTWCNRLPAGAIKQYEVENFESPMAHFGSAMARFESVMAHFESVVAHFVSEWSRWQDRQLLGRIWNEREGKLWILEFQGTDNIVYIRLYRPQVQTLSPRSTIWIRVSAVCTIRIKPRRRIEQAAVGLYIGNAETGFITRRFILNYSFWEVSNIEFYAPPRNFQQSKTIWKMWT